MKLTHITLCTVYTLAGGCGGAQVSNETVTHRPGEAVQGTGGSLSKEVIRSVVRANIDSVIQCYEAGLEADPEIFGQVLTRFVIGPTGAVQSAGITSSELAHEPTERCIRDAVLTWRFPAPNDGGLVVVNYPFQLSSEGDL